MSKTEALMMLRKVADDVREGMIEPSAMSLDGVAFECGRLGNEAMSESRSRWALFIETIADRFEEGEALAFDINEVLAGVGSHKFTLEVKSAKAIGAELRELLGNEVTDRSRVAALKSHAKDKS